MAGGRPVWFRPPPWSERFARRGDLVRTFWIVVLGVVFVLVLLGALIGG